MKKHYLLISLGFLGLLFILGTLDVFIPDDYFLQDYLRGTFTETIGILVTLVFVQLIFSRNDEKQSKGSELEAIKRAHTVLDLYITKYKIYASMVVTPIDQRERVYDTIPNNFTFNDMRDLFHPSLIIYENQEPVVLKCLRAQNTIKRVIEKILLDINFRYYPEFPETLLSYLDTVGNHNLLEGIKFHAEQKKLKNVIIKMIKEQSGEVKFMESNVINSYVALYHQIIYHRDFFTQYERLIKNFYGADDNIT